MDQRTAVVLALFCGFLFLHTGAVASQSGSDELQGHWLVVGGEHEGQPMDAIAGGTMTITGDRFRIQTASGNEIAGNIRRDATREPPHLDLLHDDGTVWEGIYRLDGTGFRLNYVQVGGTDQRPTTFVTAPDSEASVVVMERE